MSEQQTVRLSESDACFITFEVGDDVKVKVDYVAACLRVRELSNETDGKPAEEFYGQVGEYMEKIGFPPVATGVRFMFVQQVSKLTGDWEKKVESATGEPAG